jgi:hypothetical protein
MLDIVQMGKLWKFEKKSKKPKENSKKHPQRQPPFQTQNAPN